MKKKYKKALALGIGATLGAKFLGAKADAAKKLAQVDTGDFGSQMANDTNLIKGSSKALLGGDKAIVPMKKPTSFLGKAKKFLKDEVFTTDPKTKAFTLPKFKGNTKGYGDFTFTDQYGNPQGAKTGKMIKANNGMMIQSRGNKLARTKITKLS